MLQPSTLLFLMLSLCIINTASVKTKHDENGNEFASLLNAMLKKNSLPQTRQIPHCFSNEEYNSMKNVIKKLTSTAAQAGTTELKNFPNFYLNYTQSAFSKNTLSCLYKSRDFNLLMLKYAVDLLQMGAAFARAVDKSYLGVHKSFLDLKNMLDLELYEDYGKALDSMFKEYFGARIMVDSEWVKSVRNLENYNPSEYFGITASNGVIGAVSSMRPINVATTVLAGAYDVFGRGRVDNIVETFPALQLSVHVDGHDVTSDGYYNYEQSINLKLGEFSGVFSSEKCSVKYTYWALKNLPFAFYTSVELVAHDNTQLEIFIKHQVPDYLNNVQKSYENLESEKLFSFMHTKATSKTGNLDLVIASSYLIEDGTNYNNILHQDFDSNYHRLKTKTSVVKGNTYKFGIISALISTAHHEDPVNEAIRIVERAILIGEKPLVQAHRRLWDKLWRNDIVIEGNEQDQKNVRLMLYHCYAFINDFKSYGISPMGLSGLGYNGHVFWDMDLWIYPGILGLNPDLAKTLIEYRFERLQAAKNNAFINGYRGAMYPWESSKLGIEQTPIWALSGPLEHHISGCVAFAAWNYYAVTQDKQWLQSKGFKILSSVAQFWQSRVELGQDGFYHIKNVVAADEWAENVDDNAFTNAVAKQSLRLYNAAAKVLSLPVNDNYRQVSQKIIILKMPNNVTKQHNRYNGENIKQADVNLLSYPLKTITDVEQIKRDLSYYQVRIPNEGTPAMTYSIFTILYSRLMDADNAYKYFKESHQSYLKKPFNVFAETKWGTNPYFLTGAGGVIQSLVFGFGGYDITETGLKKIKTVIPKQWKSVTIKGFISSPLLSRSFQHSKNE